MGLKHIVLAGTLALTGCYHNAADNVKTYFNDRISVKYYFPPSFVLEGNPIHEEFMDAMKDYKHKVRFIPRCTAQDGNDDEIERCRSYHIGKTGASVNGDSNWKILNQEGYDELPVVLADGKRYKSPTKFCKAIGEPEDCLK